MIVIALSVFGTLLTILAFVLCANIWDIDAYATGLAARWAVLLWFGSVSLACFALASHLAGVW